MKLIRTETQGLVTTRIYLTDEGAEWVTREVPTNVLAEVGAKHMGLCLAVAERKLARLNRMAKAKRLLLDGEKPDVVAIECGIDRTTAYQLRKANR